MPIVEISIHIPEQPDLLDPFVQVNQRSFHLPGETTEELTRRGGLEDLQIATAEYLLAGMATLASNGPDKYIRDNSQYALNVLENGSINVIVTDDYEKAAIELKLPESQIPIVRAYPNEALLFAVSRESSVVSEDSYLFLPFDLIVNARQSPGSTMAKLAKLGRMITEQEEEYDRSSSYARIDATEAHFMRSVIRRNPYAGFLPKQWENLKKYPNGIESLPPNTRPQGYTGK